MLDEELRPRFWVVVVATVAALIVAVGLLFNSASPPPSGPGGPPIAPFGWAWGQPLNESGTSSTDCPSTIGHYCYSVEIASVPGGLLVWQVHLTLESANGSARSWPSDPTSDRVTLVAPIPPAECAEYDTATSQWTLLGNFTGTVGAGFTVVIWTGGAGASYGLSGDTIVYTGVDGATGTNPSATFP